MDNMESTKINVGIVEDHRVVADGFEYLINESGAASVIGKAYSVAECHRMLATKPIDVVLLDVGLPDGSGLELCPQLKADYPELKIIMLTSYSETSLILRALDGGASGYILKNAMTEEIIEGIQTVMAGEKFLCHEVNIIVKKQAPSVIRLSRREQEMLRHIVAGLSNSEIADRMFLGYETIKSYRKNLMLKLNVHNTAALVKRAIEERMV
jgi:DNA-binding NarL/FixJ family response regulator